jgi:GntR family carbon starvation induced transcriptional regulator
MNTEDANDGRPTLATSVYLRLRESILRAEFDPGSKLNMRELCEKFDVSLSPMREALSRLVSEGLVTPFAQRGFAVARLTMSGLEELVRARSWICEIGLRQSILRGDAAWEDALVLAYHRMNRIPRINKDPHERSAEWSKAHLEFHRALICASGSEWITRFCDEMFEAAERYRYFARRADRVRSAVANEHEAIMLAAVERDADRAVELLNGHFNRTAELVAHVLK